MKSGHPKSTQYCYLAFFERYIGLNIENISGGYSDQSGVSHKFSSVLFERCNLDVTDRLRKRSHSCI